VLFLASTRISFIGRLWLATGAKKNVSYLGGNAALT
jgi:hypothetical protein